MNPNGRVVGAEYGTSCIGEPQRVSAVQISEKPLRNVPATVRREAVRTPDPNWMRVRVSKARNWYRADLSVHCSPLSGVVMEVEVKES